MSYIDHSLIVIATITGCVSISAFASLVGIPIGVTSSAMELVVTTEMKKCKLIIKIKKKKKKKHDKIRLLVKSQLNRIEFLISKALVDLNISHDEFVLISNVLEEFYVMKEEVKNCNNKLKFKLYIKQCCLIV